MNESTKKYEFYIPNELWKKIKMYMLGQEYWKQKMRLCFDIPNIGYYRAFNYTKGLYTSIKSRRPIKCLKIERTRDTIKTYYRVPFKHNIVIETEINENNMVGINETQILYSYYDSVEDVDYF